MTYNNAASNKPIRCIKKTVDKYFITLEAFKRGRKKKQAVSYVSIRQHPSNTL